jgi:glycosyltransferase involved in cell wall biosynthesis
MSDRAAATFLEYGVDPEKLHVIPNFVGVASDRPKDPTTWTFAGRLSPEKGILELLDAWPSDEPLRVLGDGPLRSDVELAAAHKPGVEIVGQVRPQDMEQALSDSIGLVFPSLWAEAAPTMVYIEALSLGVPTVALEYNAVADDIALGGTGIVISDLSELPRALQQLRSRRAQFSARASERYAREFSERTWVARMTGLYGQVLGLRSRSGR